MGVSGSVDWYNKIDDNTPSLTGDLGTLVNSLVDNISDNELSNLGMTISDRIDGSFIMPIGCFVILTSSAIDQMHLKDPLGAEMMNDDNVLLYKSFTRKGTTYYVYIMPSSDYWITAETLYNLSI